mgnify:FL=1
MIKKSFKKLFCLLFLLLVVSNNPFVGSAQEKEFITVQIISRPPAKKNEVVPKNTKRSRHLAIISDVLPHGVWEMGPDSGNFIATTNTIPDLMGWPTHTVTQKCLQLEGDYIKVQFVEVNKQGLLDAIKMYEESFVGKFKYSYRSYNENYAVSTVIYAAGGPKL